MNACNGSAVLTWLLIIFPTAGFAVPLPLTTKGCLAQWESLAPLAESTTARLEAMRPEAALRTATYFSDRRLRRSALHRVACHWVRNNSKAAIAHARAAPHSLGRTLIEQEHAYRSALLDFRSTLSSVMKNVDRSARSAQIRAVFLAAGQTSGEEALEVADEIENRVLRSQAYRALFRAWASRDAATVIELFFENRERYESSDLLIDVLRALAPQDPHKAIASALMLEPSMSNKLWGVVRATSNWSPVETLRALESLEDEPFSSGLLSEPLKALARVDPIAARDWVLTREPSQGRSFMLRHVVEEWVSRDVVAVTEWLALRPAHERFVLDEVALRALADLDSAVVLRQSEYFTVPQRNELAGAHLRHLARMHPERAVKWCGRLQRLGLDGGFVYSILGAAAYNSPEEVVQLAARGTGHAASDLLHHALQAWIRRDVVAAAVWSETNQAIVRPDTLGQVATTLLDRDVDTAANFVVSLRAGQSRDRVLAAFVEQLRGMPEAARRMLAAFSDPKKRELAAVSYLRQLMVSSPPRAMEFAATIELSAEHRECLKATADFVLRSAESLDCVEFSLHPSWSPA